MYPSNVEADATSCSSNKSTLPSPCSVDDRVLSNPTTAPAVQLQHTLLKRPPLGQTMALNPSSSRFTLSIPLLGHMMVPLESVFVRSLFGFFICVGAFVEGGG